MRQSALRPSQLSSLLSNEFEDFLAALASRGKNMLLAHIVVGGKGARNHPINKKTAGSSGPVDAEGPDGDIRLGN